MIYDWRNIKDLRKASIFDLTDDIEIIRECTCLGDEIGMEDRAKYEKELNNGNFSRVDDFEAFSLYLNDGEREEFIHALKSAFSDIYEKLNTLPNGACWE